MYKKVLLFLLITIVIPCICSAEEYPQELILDFDHAAYYYFGFSAGPVDVNNKVTPIPSAGLEIESVANASSGYLNGNQRTAHAFWNIVSTQPVTLELSVDGPLYPIDDSGIAITDRDSINWKVTWDNGRSQLYSENDAGPKELVTINGSSMGTDNVSMISSKPVVINVDSLPVNELPKMIAGEYRANLTLEVRSN